MTSEFARVLRLIAGLMISGTDGSTESSTVGATVRLPNPSPGADVGGVSPVPGQMWDGRLGLQTRARAEAVAAGSVLSRRIEQLEGPSAETAS